MTWEQKRKFTKVAKNKILFTNELILVPKPTNFSLLRFAKNKILLEDWFSTTAEVKVVDKNMLLQISYCVGSIKKN